MNIATVHHSRPMLPMLSLLVAGAAITLGVVAIATDDAGSVTPSPAPVCRLGTSTAAGGCVVEGGLEHCRPIMPATVVSSFRAWRRGAEARRVSRSAL